MPISFTCPHCGTQTSVAEQYAGQAGPCKACGKMVMIPGVGPGGDAVAPAKSGAGKIVVIILAVVFGVLAIGCLGVMALLYPAITTVRDKAQQMACANNLSQLGRAMMMCEQMHRQLPAAYTTNKEGEPIQSWRAAILPFLDRQDLYDQYRQHREEAWDSPRLQEASRTDLSIFHCPGALNARSSATTNYFVVVGENTAFPPKGRADLSYVTRNSGPANTALILEVEGLDVPWAKPKDLTLDDLDKLFGPKRDPKFKCPHKSGMNVAMADGSVRTVRLDADPEMVKSLFKVKDRQVIDESKVFVDR